MYCSPDFVKVSAKVKDVFASYSLKCPYDTLEGATYTVPAGGGACPTTDPNYTYSTFLYIVEFADAPHQCYSTLDP